MLGSRVLPIWRRGLLRLLLCWCLLLRKVLLLLLGLGMTSGCRCLVQRLGLLRVLLYGLLKVRVGGLRNFYGGVGRALLGLALLLEVERASGVSRRGGADRLRGAWLLLGQC